MPTLFCWFKCCKTYKLTCPRRHPKQRFVGSTFHFNVASSSNMIITPDNLEAFSQLLEAWGVTHAWFGWDKWKGFTSTYKHWRYFGNKNQNGKDGDDLNSRVQKQMNDLLYALFDIPLYHTCSWKKEDFAQISKIVTALADQIFYSWSEFVAFVRSNVNMRSLY